METQARIVALVVVVAVGVESEKIGVRRASHKKTKRESVVIWIKSEAHTPAAYLVATRGDGEQRITDIKKVK